MVRTLAMQMLDPVSRRRRRAPICDPARARGGRAEGAREEARAALPDDGRAARGAREIARDVLPPPVARNVTGSPVYSLPAAAAGRRSERADPDLGDAAADRAARRAARRAERADPDPGDADPAQAARAGVRQRVALADVRATSSRHPARRAGAGRAGRSSSAALLGRPAIAVGVIIAINRDNPATRTAAPTRP